MEEIKIKIKKIIADKLALNENDINSECHFLIDFGADSLDLVELVMAFETKFNIEIPDSKVEKLETVGDVEIYIINKIINKNYEK